MDKAKYQEILGGLYYEDFFEFFHENQTILETLLSSEAFPEDLSMESRFEYLTENVFIPNNSIERFSPITARRRACNDNYDACVETAEDNFYIGWGTTLGISLFSGNPLVVGAAFVIGGIGNALIYDNNVELCAQTHC